MRDNEEMGMGAAQLDYNGICRMIAMKVYTHVNLFNIYPGSIASFDKGLT